MAPIMRLRRMAVLVKLHRGDRRRLPMAGKGRVCRSAVNPGAKWVSKPVE
jgi:hypothetical protein